MFRIAPFVCILGEVDVSYIFCFIFRPLSLAENAKQTIQLEINDNKHSTICPPSIYIYLFLFFLQDFQSEVEVKNLDTKESYMIHERVVRDSVWLQMASKDDKTRTCSYSKLSGFGHTIYGKRLTYKEIFPNK